MGNFIKGPGLFVIKICWLKYKQVYLFSVTIIKNIRSEVIKWIITSHHSYIGEDLFSVCSFVCLSSPLIALPFYLDRDMYLNP